MFGEEQLSFGELAAKVLGVAKEITKTVQPGTMVPILFKRSVDCIVGIYGVVAAGCAYVPLDPEYPADRLMHIIEQTGSGLGVSNAEMVHKIPAAFAGATLNINEVPAIDHAMREAALIAHRRVQDPDTLIYVFFTSGTTGKPKGVMVSHRALVKRIQWFQDEYSLSPEARVLHKTPYVFGISEWELFWAPLHGGTVVICPDEHHKDPEALLQITAQYKIDMTFTVPSMLNAMLDFLEYNKLPPVNTKAVFCCGEALLVDTCRAFHGAFPGAELVNLCEYTPDCTIAATSALTTCAFPLSFRF